MESKNQKRKTYKRRLSRSVKAVLPEERSRLADTIDTVHRLGTKQQNDNKPKGIIIQFIARVYRDAVWKAAKTSPHLRDNVLRFAEDLSKEDRKRRNKLWPVIKKAREEGKPAFFIGGLGFVSGSEVSLPT